MMTAERAQELRNSTLWNEVVLELGDMAKTEMNKLRVCKPEEVIKIQARLEIIEFLKVLPETAIDRDS